MSQLCISRHWLVASVSASAVALLTWTGCQQTSSSPAADKPAPNATAAVAPAPAPKESPAVAQFHKVVQPILQERCYECHGEGASKGGIAFDELTPEHIAGDPQLW